MSTGLTEQIERRSLCICNTHPVKYWRQIRKSNAFTFLKRRKNRLERRKAHRDPECLASYGKFGGWWL